MSRGPLPLRDGKVLRVRFAVDGTRKWEATLDGLDLTGHLTEISVHGAVNDITRVKMTLIGLKLDVEGEVLKLATDVLAIESGEKGERCSGDSPAF